jgi:hypothetical protein
LHVFLKEFLAMLRRFLLVSLLLALIAGLALALAAENRLAGRYTDPACLAKIPFGAHSHWLQPWRAYLETVPARKFLDGVGINLHLKGENPDLVLQMLAKCGVANARVEIGWGNVSYEDETRINGGPQFRAVLQACKRWNVRPMILLNSHHGVPCPVRMFERTATVGAAAGATRIELDDTRDLVVGKSGLSGLTTYWAAEAMVTAIDGRRVMLSKPLPKAIPAGTKVRMATLKYRPFSVPGSPDYRETIAGWQRYVGAVAAMATDALGTAGGADKGFDVEVWNELTFGTHFLSINNYYRPPLAKYDERTVRSDLVKATADYLDGHAEAFQGVRLADGFANTIPWPAAGDEPRRVVAIDKHPYAGRKAFPKDEQKGTRLDAQGEKTDFVPNYSMIFPEYYATAIQTETLVRDMGPITNVIYGAKHGRYARGAGDPVSMWITEVGVAPNEIGIRDRQAALALKAKTTARYLAFFLNKGVEKLQLFGAVEGDLWLGIVQDNFCEYARKNRAYPTDDAPYTSPALMVMRRMTGKMREGLDPSLTVTRSLAVESVSDRHNHFQFPGDGTAAHPPLYDREVLAILPYQVNSHKFVIAFYVMTRDVTKDLAPEEFTIELSGLKEASVTVSSYDPIRDRTVPVRVDRRPERGLSLTVTAADYPCLLEIEE